MLKYLISYILSKCFASEFCKYLWAKRKLTRRAAWHMVRDEWGDVFWLVEKTTCQSGSFKWTNNNLCERCGCPNFSKPVKGPVLYCTISVIAVYLYSLFGCWYALLLRELENKYLNAFDYELRIVPSSSALAPWRSAIELETAPELPFYYTSPLRKFVGRRVVVNGIDETLATDLVNMQAFSRWNKGVKYLLNIIDIFPKDAWIVRHQL